MLFSEMSLELVHPDDQVREFANVIGEIASGKAYQFGNLETNLKSHTSGDLSQNPGR
jgi:hypothetical protein